MPTGDTDRDRDPIDLMAESFLERFRRGERPSIDDYAARYPEIADEVRELLPALVQLEQDFSVDGESRATGARVPTLKGAPRRLGDYTILREVGRGGMGVVYEAVQQSLGRHVALKVLPWQELGSSSQLERFALEARSAAKLHHTNIVPVFGVGEHDGTHYYAMQFIRGQGLDQVIAELRRLRRGIPEPQPAPSTGASVAATVAQGLISGRFGTPTSPGPSPAEATLDAPDDRARRFNPSGASAASGLIHGSEFHGSSERQYHLQVARLGLQVAEALAYAHGQGILHRDIKPSNLLIDTHGTVWITDFGLAKAEGSDGPTRTGDIVGTLRYMGPERFEGRSDPRSDVYALGATLYELLTLEPLFGEVNRLRLVDQILHDPPTPPRKLDRHIPRDLETIVVKALAKEPGRRYADAEAMAEDLRRVVEDRPVLARRISATEQFWRWCRRRPAIAGLTALVLVLMVFGTVAASMAAHHFRSQWEDLRLEQRRALVAERNRLEASALSLLTTLPDGVPVVAEGLRPSRDEVLPVLRRALAESPAGPARLRAAIVLTLLGDDHSPELVEAIPTASPAESRNLLLALTTAGGGLGAIRDAFAAARSPVVRARYTAALLAFGDSYAARALLTAGADPAGRAEFIHMFEAWHGDLVGLATPLREVDDPDFRGGAASALARIEPDRLTPAERDALVPVLLDLYREGRGGGTHSAAASALRRWGVAPPAIQATRSAPPGRGWFVNGLGLTMIELPAGPMPGHGSYMLPVALSSTEVTVAQFRRFLDDPDEPAARRARGLVLPPPGVFIGAGPDHPIGFASWNDAVLFCNWLSRREGRAPCYERARGGAWSCRFEADGYRLPAHAEWEYATRAGASTPFFVGQSPLYLDDYALILGDESEPVAGRLPNGWGFYDLIGNVWDLCWETSTVVPTGWVHPIGPGDGPAHVMMGTSYGGGTYGAGFERGFSEAAGSRRTTEPTVGFRVACAAGCPESPRPPVSADPARRAASLRELLRTRTGDADGWLALGRSLSDAGDPNGALAALREVARLRPRDAAVRVAIGSIEVRCGRPRVALGPLREAIRLDPSSTLAIRNLAWAATETRDLDLCLEAARGLVPIEARDETMPPLQIEMARRLTIAPSPPGSESVALAVRLARADVASRPREPSYRATLGLALCRAGDARGAIVELDIAARLAADDSNYAPIGLALALALARDGQREKALLAFDRAVAVMDRGEPDDPDLAALRAEAESTLDLSRPRPDFRAVLGDLRLPALAGPALDRGTGLARNGRWHEALGWFRRAIAAGPESFRAAGREEHYAWACYAASVLYRECGDIEGYRRHVRLIRETVRPGDHPSDLERPAKASLLAPPPTLAEAEALRAMAEAAVARAGPDHPYRSWYLQSLALAEYRTGRWREAIAAVEASRAAGGLVPPQEVTCLLLLAISRCRLGQAESARALLREAHRQMAADQPPPFSRSVMWYDWLYCRGLAREADALIRDDPIFPADPFKK